MLLAAVIIDPQELLALFAPVITWLAVFSANWLKAKLGTSGFGGTVIMVMVVPICSFFASMIVDYLLNPGLSFLIIFFLSFVSVFIAQFIRQWNQTRRGTQNSLEPTLSSLAKKG